MADRRILRLIHKWLKAGVSEDGQWSETKIGTPQGAVVSPLLANVYLHYVFDLWVEVWRKRVASGEVIVVRYADDLVVGFQYRTDAERFLQEFRERLANKRTNWAAFLSFFEVLKWIFRALSAFLTESRLWMALRRTRNFPVFHVCPQMRVKPRKLNVSGFPAPRSFRFATA